MSPARKSLQFTGTFEAELLVELMLRFWKHPLAADREYRTNLLEQAAEVLQASVSRVRLTQDIKPQNMNLVSVVWYAEAVTIGSDPEISSSQRKKRNQWLTTVRQSIPSCFCDPDLLT
jgi:hypothetical protein